MLISPQQLKQICTTISTERAAWMADLLNEICPKYGLDTLDEFHEFLANVVQESGEFSPKVENMNYTTAARIRSIWPSRFPTIGHALPYVRQPQKLANFVYGGRMGNNQPGDGWLFRGGGFIGLTGREVYTKYSQYIKQPVETVADLIRTSDKYALDSACWFFSVLKGLNDEAERDEMQRIIKSINGGMIGADVRMMYYDRIKKVLNITN